jgi:hypothetical protein
VSFAANEGDPTPASQQVTVTVNTGTVFISTQGGGGNSGFTQSFALTGPTTGVITIVPNDTGTPGNFSSQISVRGCMVSDCLTGEVVGSPQIITVTYTVTAAPALSVNPSALLFTAATGAAPPAQSLDLSIAGGNGAWTSTFNYIGPVPLPLSVTPASGAFPATASVELGAVTTPGTYTGTIVFAAGASQASVPITVVVVDPKVELVAPYVGTSGRAGDVILRGHGFTAAALQVDFGGAAATASTFVSDTEIRASYPALAAGSYPVHVRNGGAPLATRATLVVVDPPAYAAATIPRSGPNPDPYPLNLVYDDERKSIYVMDNSGNRIEAYGFTDAWRATLPPFVGTPPALNPRMAFAPDGTEILMASNDRLWRVDPATLMPVGAVPTTPPVASTESSNTIAYANDGRALVSTTDKTGGTSLFSYDMLTQQLAPLSTDPELAFREIFASGDGSMLLLATGESLNELNFKPVIAYDAGTGTLTTHATVKTGGTFASLDRTAAHIVMVSLASFPADQRITVYDHDLNELGKLPTPLEGVVISPDGTTVFAYEAGSGGPGTLRKFDLTSPPVNGVFPEVGGGTPVPDSLGTTFLPMAISADGGSLFLAGDQKIVVMPAP